MTSAHDKLIAINIEQREPREKCIVTTNQKFTSAYVVLKKKFLGQNTLRFTFLRSRLKCRETYLLVSKMRNVF